MTKHLRRRYEYRGPIPGSYWDDPHVTAILRSVSAIVREVHEHAGFPSTNYLGQQTDMPSYVTVHQLLVGGRLPTWSTTWRIAHGLALRAGYDHARLLELRQRLHKAYANQ